MIVVPFNYNLNEFTIESAISMMKMDKEKLVFKNHSKCQDCYKRKLCRYCPERFFLETGRYDLPPDFYCQMADDLIEEFDDEL